MIYVVAFILILYSWILVDLKRYRKLSSVCICVIIVFLILIAGLRYRVGGDSLHYIDTYTSMPTWKNWEFFSFDEGYGPLWYLFCAISKTLGADFVYLQLLHAIIVNLTFLYVFKKRSVNVISCFLIYFLIYYIYYNMEILREALAVCIFCFNISNLMEKRYFRYYLGCLFSIGFHFSALVLLVFPLLNYLLKAKYANWLLGIGGGIVLLVFFYILPNHYMIFMDFMPIIGLKLKSYSTLEMNNVLGIMYYAISFVAFLGFYLIANKNRFMSKQDNCIMKMLLLFLFLGAMNQGLMRIANYLIPFAIPYVVNVGYSLITMEKFAYNKILFIGCFAFLIFQKSYYYLADTSHLAVHTRQYELWYPYESVFKPIKHTHRELIFYNAMYNQSVIRTSGE